jgi:hypothetical protein
MRRISLASAATAVLFAASTAMAQAKPNFAGKWVIIPDTASTFGMSPGGGEAGGLSNEATITMDDKTMTVTRMTPTMGEMKSVFNLDGTETYSQVNVQGQQIPLTMKTRWDGKKLITSTFANVGQQIEIILNFWLDDKGNLVTEHTVPPLGNGMNGGTLITHYKKAS